MRRRLMAPAFLQMWAKILLATCLSLSNAAADFTVQLLITGDIRGAVYPVDKYGSQCESADANHCPALKADWKCSGGAARRFAALAPARVSTSDDVVALDTGSYFFGSGLFFPTFKGTASVEMLTSSGYGAFGIAYRDLTAGISKTDTTGGMFFASYLKKVRDAAPTLLPAVATNFNITGHPHLTSQDIAPYKIIQLASGRRMAFLSLLDPTHLRVRSPETGERVMDTTMAIQLALTSLRREPAGMPEVVVLSITRWQESEAALMQANGHVDDAREKEIKEMISQNIGIDIVLWSGHSGTRRQASLHKNWYGDNVLVVPVNFESNGVEIDKVVQTFDSKGILIPGGSTSATKLDCSVGLGDSTTWSRLSNLEQTVATSLGGKVGTVSGAFDNSGIFEVKAGDIRFDRKVCTRFRQRGKTSAFCGCRVSQCSLGGLIADAVQWKTGADVAFTNAGAIRSSLKDGTVTKKDVMAALPFNNEVKTITHVSGQKLFDVLTHSIKFLSLEDADSSPDPGFLQLSANLKIEWFFEGSAAKIRRNDVDIGTTTVKTTENKKYRVLMNGVALNVSKYYTVATSEWLANGGDGYAMLKKPSSDSKSVGHGYTETDAVVEYLSSAEAASSPYFSSDDAPAIKADYPRRFKQLQDVRKFSLGILCKGGGTSVGKEHCDAIKSTVDMINDKEDGFMDDILTYAKIETYTQEIGCSKTFGKDAVRNVTLHFKRDPAAMIGPTCTGESRELSDAVWRKDPKVDNSLAWRQAEFDISKSNYYSTLLFTTSQAPSLQDRTKYPNMVRAYLPSHLQVDGFRRIMYHYKWNRVGMIHDHYTWSREVANDFRTKYEGDIELVNPHNLELPSTCTPPSCFEGVFTALEAQGAKIIFLVMSDDQTMRKLLHYSKQANKLHGPGYAWVNAWISEEILKDSANDKTDLLAAQAMEGMIGLQQSFEKSHSMFQDWARVWSKVSSSEACARGSHERGYGGIKYCDADGKNTSLSMDAATLIDAVILYAKAMDAIYLNDPVKAPTAADLYARVQLIGRAGEQPGISGLIKLDENDDRTGVFAMLNVQIVEGARRRLRDARSLAMASVQLETTEVIFKEVGTYSSKLKKVCVWQEDQASNGKEEKTCVEPYLADEEKNIYREKSAVVFSAKTKDIPLDKDPEEEGMNWGLVAGIVAAVVVPLCCCFCCYCGLSQRRIANLKADLGKLKDQMVGVQAVKQDFDPRVLLAGGDPIASAPTASASIAAAPTFRSLWYWQEDTGRLDAHNKLDIYNGCYVKYAGSVCAELEEKYSEFKAGTGPRKVGINLTDRIASTGTETKAYAADSGNDFEIDFDAMKQINKKTGFGRAILRREMEVAAAESMPWEMANAKSLQSNASNPDKGNLKIPGDLAGEDLLIIYTGQLLQYSQKRKDGWAFGLVIFDPTTDRPPLDTPGVSQSAGWFPMRYAGNPNQAQMQKLQDVMGGSGASAALDPPEYWEPVKDPMVPMRFEVKGEEKAAVVKAFMATLPPNITVVSVERVENMSLWQSYAVKRQTVITGCSKEPSQVEKIWLFHGTTEEIIPKILQQGFNRSFCGRNATMYGKGVYFARDASYSASPTYAKPDSKGHQTMFLCRVTVGDYCQGKKDALSPDVKEGHILYDSTVDNMRDPSIYVAYHDGQGYPEYLVKFKQ